MRRLFYCALTWIAGLVLGCGTGGQTLGTDVNVAADVPAEVGEVAVGPEVEGIDVPVDLQAMDLLDVRSPEMVAECEPGSGCFGDPCDGHGDCLYGPCVLHMGNKVCSQSCIEECPSGWQCEQVAHDGPDLTYACVSPFTHLCRPCVENADCESATGIKDVCVDYGPDGRFCGAACLEGTCPDGYECEESTTADGSVLLQCVNQSGICACSQEAVKLGLATVCFAENELGTCGGQRGCSETGLSPCNAPMPAEETCNGIDDDCDGTIDGQLCDDGNDCTVDSCDPDSGCVNEPLTGTDCTDGDVCTLADHCEDGVCVGTTIDCNDDNPCTTDGCEPTGGCTYTFNSSTCDDGNPCTVSDTCKQGQCQGFDINCDCAEDSDCLALEDGDICNGTLVCNTDKIPYACQVSLETVVSCPEPEGADAPCLVASCHPLSGECSFEPTNDGAPCDDGDPCTLGDTCAEGICEAGVPANCNDGNSCTDDSCEPGVGCLSANNQDACNDGDPCTTGDVCTDGTCIGSAALVCDDGNPCTDDTCDPQGGCVHTPNLAPCDDGNACTTDDLCAGGQCVGKGTLVCDDGNLCTDDLCNAESGCIHNFNAVPCDDGNACSTVDLCLDGACAGTSPLVCDDGSPCTDDACAPDSGCQFTANQAACSDGNACTTGDVCSNKACVPGEAVDCDDGNLCTTDSCAPDSGCHHEFNSAPCDDGNACTTKDICVQGLCLGDEPLECDDGNPCTDDSCAGDEGCVFAPNQAECDDGNACTTEDSCVMGKCQGSSPPDCDDDNLCTDDTCSPETGCVHTLNSAPCDDGNLCSTKDACHLGECVGSGELACDDGNLCTDDACSPQTGCTHVANNVPCDDANACTDDDTCANGWCSGVVVNCSDDNLCTDDACDPDSGCTYTNNESPCDDGSMCTLVDTCANGLCVGAQAPNCDDGNVCTDDSCQADLGCVYTNNLVDCDDHNACTDGDTCSSGECQPGQQISCDDSDICTSDSCDTDTGCVNTAIDGCCKVNGDCDDGNVNTADVCVDNSCQNILDEGLPHNSQSFSHTHTAGSGGCGDYSVWYMKSFGSMTWRECEKKANLYGAQFVGSPELYSNTAPYASQQRWVGEKDVNNAYVTVGGWSSVSSVSKSSTSLCVLGYANGTSSGNSTFATTKVWDGRTYRVKDFGTISEKTCYNYCRQHGARPLNPVLFGSSGTSHMVENHSCHGSVQYNGGGTAADGGASHNYKCFIGYYDAQ